MSVITAETIVFFFLAFVGIVAIALVVISIGHLIRWIRAVFKNNGKPVRVRIGIAMVFFSILFLVFYCTELLPNLQWPFHL